MLSKQIENFNSKKISLVIITSVTGKYNNVPKNATAESTWETISIGNYNRPVKNKYDTTKQPLL